MKGSQLLLFDKRLTGYHRFNLLWNLAFFLLETYFALVWHSMAGLFFMFLFAGLFLWSVHQAKAYLATLPVEADKE